MKKIRYSSSCEMSFMATDELHVEVRPGVIEGFLGLQPFIDPQLCSPDDGYSKVEFTFCAIDGVRYLYSSLLPFMEFWPTTITEYDSAVECVDPDISLFTVVDARKPYVVKMSNGEEICGVLKYVDSALWANIRPDGLDVHLKFYHADSSEYRMVSYKKSIESLLWKKAPRFLGIDDFEAFGSSHVDVRPYDGSGLSMRNSPIVVGIK